VSGSADKTIKCWDVATGKELRTMTGHTGTVSFVVYSADGVYIASGSADKTIKFWDPVNGRLLQTLTGHTKTIASIAYSHNGKFMASGSWDNTVKIYYAVGGAEIMTLTGHTDSVFAVAFSPDGEKVASGSRDHTIRIWNVTTGAEERRIEGLNDAVWSIAYSPDGTCIAGSSANGSVKIWDAASGRELHSLKGHVNPVRSLNYSADGKYLSSGDSGGIIRMWNTSSGECLATMLKNKDGEWVTWTPEGFFTGSEWALENLSYTPTAKEYSIAQVYDKLYRPDLVAKKIGGDDIKEIAQTTSFAQIVRCSNIPEVNFDVGRDNASDRDAILNIRISDQGSGIGRVLLKLNERVIIIADGMKSKPGQSVSLNYPVTLRNGENVISVSAYDAAGIQESAQSTKKIAWRRKTEKPRLFILAVAVNGYRDPAIGGLKNCVADADGIISSFSKYSGDVYADVYVQTLMDSEVTSDNLRGATAAIGEKVKPDDVFVFYLAGHGVTYSDGDYYYLPYDFQYQTPASIKEKGISKWEMIKDLSGIRAEHIMLLLDTCNAGSFMASVKDRQEASGMDRDAIIERFATQAGFDTLAACSTYQDALDNYKGHGIFTYHIMEALEGYADLNEDKCISSTELSYYVITQVPIVSEKEWGYRQEPQRVLPTPDFTIAGAENPRTARSLKQEPKAEAPAAAAAPPPVAPSEAAGTPVKATIAFDDFGIDLAPGGDGIEAQKLDPTADGKASYSIALTAPLKLSFSSPYAERIDASTPPLIFTDGEERRIEMPTGYISLPGLPSEAKVTIGSERTTLLENASDAGSAFRSKALPIGEYRVTISGGIDYSGLVTIREGALVAPTGYVEGMRAAFEARKGPILAKKKADIRCEDRSRYWHWLGRNHRERGSLHIGEAGI